MAKGIHQQFEEELASVLRGDFPGIEITEPRWIDADTPPDKEGKYCELWFNKTQCWIDVISDHMITVTLMNADKSWDIVMERNIIAVIYLMIGFDNYSG